MARRLSWFKKLAINLKQANFAHNKPIEASRCAGSCRWVKLITAEQHLKKTVFAAVSFPFPWLSAWHISDNSPDSSCWVGTGFPACCVRFSCYLPWSGSHPYSTRARHGLLRCHQQIISLHVQLRFCKPSLPFPPGRTSPLPLLSGSGSLKHLQSLRLISLGESVGPHLASKSVGMHSWDKQLHHGAAPGQPGPELGRVYEPCEELLLEIQDWSRSLVARRCAV